MYMEEGRFSRLIKSSKVGYACRSPFKLPSEKCGSIRLSLDTGEQLGLRIPNITPELIASFDWTLWLPRNYAKALPLEECYPVI